MHSPKNNNNNPISVMESMIHYSFDFWMIMNQIKNALLKMSAHFYLLVVAYQTKAQLKTIIVTARVRFIYIKFNLRFVKKIIQKKF